MWERNARFYIPKIYGDHKAFRNFIQSKYQAGRPCNRTDSTIWGPQSPDSERDSREMKWPPAHAPTPADDDFEWGVGENADLVTLLPVFNPGTTRYVFHDAVRLPRRGTSSTTRYVFHDAYWNYPPALDPAGPPWRTAIVTFYRLSRDLLYLMHNANARAPGRHMSSETWPQSVALHHGLKAVYAPHSIYMEQRWPAEVVDFIFNNGDQPPITEGFPGCKGG